MVIPVYKNRNLFLANLRQNQSFLKGSELIIVDDAPDPLLQEAVKDLWPDARYLRNRQNLGFGLSVNRGVRQAGSDFVLLLNSDVVLTDSKILDAHSTLRNDPNLFAVSFAQTEKDGRTVGANRGYFRDGLFHHSPKDCRQACPILWPEGGSALVNKKLFLKLGGYSGLFAPFYWEDVDLGYRAWKSGYGTLFNPDIKVIHHHESTIGKYFPKNFIRSIAYRNQFLFFWQNVTDKNLLTEHFRRLPGIILGNLMKGNFPLISGFCRAVMKLPALIKARRILVKSFIRPDSEVMALHTS